MSVYSSLRISAVERPLLSIFNFAGLVAISRILSPDEIGVQVLAASIMMLAAELKNFGVGSFLIRHKNITKELIQNTFTISLLSSFSLAVVLIASSSLISEFFDDNRVTYSVQIIATTFFFVPFVAITTAMLAKNFEFKKLAINRLSEVFTTQTSCVTLALLDVGYLSLPIGIFLGNLISFLIFLYFKPSIVSFKFHTTGIRKIISSNVFITLNAGIRRLILVLPEILIGVVSTTANTAIYSRGTGIVNFGLGTLQSLLSAIVSPYFARENNQEGASGGTERAFVYVNSLMGIFLFPLLVVVGLMAKEAIMVLFGIQWIDAANIASIISIAMIFKFFYSYFNEYMVTICREKVLVKIQILELCILASSCLISSYWGWNYMPFAILATFFSTFLVKTFFLFSQVQGILSSFVKSNLKNYVVAIVLALCMILYKELTAQLNIESELATLGLVLLLACVTWLFLVLISRHEIITVLKKFLSK